MLATRGQALPELSELDHSLKQGTTQYLLEEFADELGSQESGQRGIDGVKCSYVCYLGTNGQ